MSFTPEFPTVKDLQTATFDSNVLVKVTNSATEKARQMRAGLGGLDVDDLVTAFFSYLGGYMDVEQGESPLEGELEWEKIGRLAMAKSRRVPAMDFM